MRKIYLLLPGVILIWVFSSVRAEDVGVEVKKVEESHVIGLRAQTSLQQMGQAMERVFGEIFRYVGQKGIQPIGPPLTVYYSAPGSGIIDFEVCLPVPVDATGEGDIKEKILPGGSMASLIHVGSYRKIHTSYSALTQWIEQNGYSPTGPPREVYLKGPESTSDQREYRTEILIPIN